MPAGSSRSLAAFQDAFARALFARPDDVDRTVADLVAQPAFAVYRNTVMKSCIDALQANFPAVARLTGDEWFRAAAAEYVAGERPGEASLLAYGASFAAFLAGFPPAAELPYLADVARLDRAWTEAHVAADAPALRMAELVGFDPGVLAGAVLVPHPAARWAWFANAPIYAIWRSNRERHNGEGEIPWRGEGALLTRPDDAVAWTGIDRAACCFLDACAAGRSIERSLGAALEADSDADVTCMVSTILDAGAVSRLVVATD
jgi:hypothetical protein